MADPTLRLEKLSSLLAELGVRARAPFRVPAIIEEALTHRSYSSERGGKHNERLEMLGDAVLGFLVAELLFDIFPDAPEGVLTRLRASMVEEESLARQARQLGIGDLLLLGRGEDRSGGRDRDSVLANAFEAVLAALYRSEGLELVTSLIRRLFREEAIAKGAEAPQPADFKTMLQERAQSEWKRQPEYAIVSASGPDHARVFIAEVRICGISAGQGEGRSKKAAEQMAASVALSNWTDVVKTVAQQASLAGAKSGD